MFHLAETIFLAYLNRGCWASQGLGALVFPSASNRIHEQTRFLPPLRLLSPNVAADHFAVPLAARKDAPCSGFNQHLPAKFLCDDQTGRPALCGRLRSIAELCISRALPGHCNTSQIENLFP